MKRIDLEQLNKPQLIELVQQQTDMIQELTDTLSQVYQPFWLITCDALDYAMEACGLDNQEMREVFLDLYRKLDAYDDAGTALARCKKLGCLRLFGSHP